jgi:hypothetical protein
MSSFFDELHQLEQAIAATLDKVPEDKRPRYEVWLLKHLREVRREFAQYIKQDGKADRRR